MNANAPLAYYREAFEALPLAERDARRPAWERFERLGFPQRRVEDWKYTDLTELAGRRFPPGPGTVPELDPGLAIDGAPVVRFHDGRRVVGPSEKLELDADYADGSEENGNGVVALNAALARDGVDWVVRGSGPQTLHLVCTQSGGMAHLRHRVRVPNGAEAALIVDIRGGEAEAFATRIVEITLEAGSRLTLLRLQRAGASTTDIAQTQVTVGRDALFTSVTLDLGAGLARHDLNVLLAEPGAEARLHGVFAPAGRTHTDTHTRIVHRAPRTTSRETYRGLVFEQASAVFNGKIVIERDAQKSDSEQHIASLLLSDKAQVNAKPELEIYADDVKCAHGATCGQLDETAIYYLRSRGLPEDTARNLLLFTFAYEVLAKIGLEPARRAFEGALLARLPGGPSVADLS